MAGASSVEMMSVRAGTLKAWEDRCADTNCTDNAEQARRGLVCAWITFKTCSDPTWQARKAADVHDPVVDLDTELRSRRHWCDGGRGWRGAREAEKRHATRLHINSQWDGATCQPICWDDQLETRNGSKACGNGARQRAW